MRLDTKGRGRPAGSYGDVTRALLSAAERQPGTVRDLAARSQVGYSVATKAVSRLKAAGLLAAVSEGRPEVLAPNVMRERISDHVMILDRIIAGVAGSQHGADSRGA